MAVVLPLLLKFLAGPVLEEVTKFIPDPQAKAQAQLAILQLQATEEYKQIDAQVQLAQQQANVDAIEAASADKFKSRWRPFIGWVCGVAFALNFVIAPLATWIAALAHHPLAFPPLDMVTMLPVLLGMLGLGGYRTTEKIKGVA